MKKTIFLLSLIVGLMACQTNPENAGTVGREQADTQPGGAVTPAEKATLKTLDDIRVQYQRIVIQKQNGALSTSSFKYDCSGEKSGTVTFYSDDNGLQLIEHQRSEYSHFEATDQYYVMDDRPFFVYYEHTSWSFDEAGGQDNATRDNITEQRFYLINHELVQCLEKNYTTRSSTEENPLSAEVPNREVACPPVEELTASFAQLLKYQDQRQTIGCLE